MNGDTGNNGIKKYTGVKDHRLNLDYVQVRLMLKAYVAHSVCHYGWCTGGVLVWRWQDAVGRN